MPHLVDPPPPASLPLIDLSPFLLPTPDPAARRNTALKLHSACLDYGFFYCAGLDSVVSPDDMRQALDVARAFFNTPDDDKLKLRIKPGDGARGPSPFPPCPKSSLARSDLARSSRLPAHRRERHAVQEGLARCVALPSLSFSLRTAG